MRRNSEVEVTYSLDEDGQERHEALAHIVNNLAAPVRVWLVVESGAQNWKRSGGAATGIKRVPLSVAAVKLRGHRSNIQIPGMQGRGFTIAFMPDALYLQTRDGTTSADYEQLTVDTGVVRYVEDEAVPPGAKQIGDTWLYVNKDGSRDRRFSHNRKLPVLEYGTVHLSAEPDLALQIQVSTQEAAQEFRNDLEHYCEAVRAQTSEGSTVSATSNPQSSDLRSEEHRPPSTG